MRRLTRLAFAICWPVFAVTVFLAGRKVLAVPDGRGDITGLLVATICGTAGLSLLAIWLQDLGRSLLHYLDEDGERRTPDDDVPRPVHHQRRPDEGDLRPSPRRRSVSTSSPGGVRR